MARKRRGAPIDGILVFDKPAGMTSNDAVQWAKRRFGAQKVGHTGALDPLATGVLPLCFGEATKFSQFLLESDKRYWTRIRLGVTTDSGDADGQTTGETEVPTSLDAATIEAALAAFRGPIEQVPSMFSALKHQGQPLYKLARQGVEVPREARRVEVFSNELVGFDGRFIELELHCSKGTYVRSIAEDLGAALGCGAHVTELRRRSAGPFNEVDAVDRETFEHCEDRAAMVSLLKPIESAVAGWPELKLNDDLTHYVRQGQAVIVPHAPTAGWVRLMRSERLDEPTLTCSSAHQFIGVGEILDDGRVAPRRLVVDAASRATGAL
ncbi:MAG: tRNA pseudouridine(55) synthase TruB [Pseudomonadota bacterium]